MRHHHTTTAGESTSKFSVHSNNNNKSKPLGPEKTLSSLSLETGKSDSPSKGHRRTGLPSYLTLLCSQPTLVWIRIRGAIDNGIMNVAQRRGGKGQEKRSTLMVEDPSEEDANNNNNNLDNNNNGNTPVEVAVPIGDASKATIPKAYVRRKFCGTGPFDKHWLNLDCCGLFCAFITYCLHAYAVYVVTLILIPPWMSTTITNTDNSNEENAEVTATKERIISWAGFWHRTVFTTIAILAVLSHFKAMTTDPGAVPPDAQPLEDIDESNNNGDKTEEVRSLLDPPSKPKMKRLCRRCKSFKPQRAHHCSVCRRCIVKMDHHCPWVNNCVGIGNHKYFLLFVFYTCISCCYSLILVVSRFSTCPAGSSGTTRAHRRNEEHYEAQHVGADTMMMHHHHHRHHSHRYTCLDKPSHLLSILGLLIEAILFGMFTCCMMFDQAGVIQTKVTHIDKLKGLDIGGGLAGVTEVFGVGKRRSSNNESRFRFDWLSPFIRPCIPSSVVDEVMGFTRHSCQQQTTEDHLGNSSRRSTGAVGVAEII